MKALVYFGPEDIRITQMDELKPEKDEVLIKVKAVGICGSDIHGYLGITGRRIPPMVMGHEFAGIIFEIGANVKKVARGDRVTVQPVKSCGECECCKNGFTNVCTNLKFLGVMDINGAMAEYVCVPEDMVIRLPDSLSYTQGALIEPLAVAYRAVKRVAPLENNTVLIIGAGTIGLLVLKLVKLMNAKKIFVTDLTDFRLKIAKKSGADIVINPSRENIMEAIQKETGIDRVDVTIEAVGVSSSVQQSIEVLKNKGKCVWIGNSSKVISINMQEIVTRELEIYGTYLYTCDEFREVIELLGTGRVDAESVVSKYITLEEGPAIFKELAKGPNELIKVMITN